MSLKKQLGAADSYICHIAISRFLSSRALSTGGYVVVMEALSPAFPFRPAWGSARTYGVGKGSLMVVRGADCRSSRDGHEDESRVDFQSGGASQIDIRGRRRSKTSRKSLSPILCCRRLGRWDAVQLYPDYVTKPSWLFCLPIVIVRRPTHFILSWYFSASDCRGHTNVEFESIVRSGGRVILICGPQNFVNYFFSWPSIIQTRTTS